MTLANFQIDGKSEKTKLNFKSKNLEEYNRPFSLDELRKSLDKAHDTACGPDDIHYQLLKHLPESALQVLLDLISTFLFGKGVSNKFQNEQDDLMCFYLDGIHSVYQF
jgi:hypothetical protein